MSDYDVIVIGCGPAGQKAAIKCGKVGAKVAVIDERQVVGGNCLHIGTIPSKTIRSAIIYLSGYHEKKMYGDNYRVKENITADDLLYRCNRIIRREIDVIHSQLVRNHVDVISGHGHFLDANTMRVEDTVGTEDYTSDNFIIASGARSYSHYNPPYDNVHIFNTDDILEMRYLPRKLCIIGGGVIGLEYAGMFSLLGIEVHVISQYKSLLPFVDRELIEVLKGHMVRHGVVFHMEEELSDIHVAGPKDVRANTRAGDELQFDMMFIAAQRWGNTNTLNLSSAGVEVHDKDYLKVDSSYKTNIPHIYAAGDVIGYPSLAATSIDQGRKAANAILEIDDIPYEPLFPYGIYTCPDISMIGESEENLKKSGTAYEVGVGYFGDTAKGQMTGNSDGMVKLLFDPEDHKILGVHIIGFESTELIHIGQCVMINGGRLDYFIDTVFNYPTMAEAYKIAALNGFNKLKVSMPRNIADQSDKLISSTPH